MQQLINYIDQVPCLGMLITFLIGLAFMPLVIKIAKKHNFVVKPNKRTSHQGDVPNVGGLDIFISFVIFFYVFEYYQIPNFYYLLMGICAILLVGFIDDLIDLKAFWKLVGEIVAGCFLIFFADVRITNMHGIFSIWELSPVVSYLISFFVYVAIINALNLIDGVDGLASGMGILYACFFAVYFHLTGSLSLSLLAYGLVGALIVFFLYNVFGGTRRKIFMGDSGSLLLGFLISYLVFQFLELNAYWSSDIPNIYHIKAAPAVAICVLFVPLFDTVRVAIKRIKKGTSPFKPDKNHIHHLLLRTGLRHRQVTGVLMGVTLCFITLGILCRNWSSEWLILLSCAIGVALMFLLWHIVAQKDKLKSNNENILSNK
ncbi:MAG: undecaprenyl/decaprenyl-phosphate alpha-N-acetylglucosaminyl 1-phosphate transferase [Sphingobacteriia bacterium]|nr:undecaprenyl/decaprenyl-phosphate alpha-N-acetylglucosaminyl 1-phosphate transferase [Sphingobacteriia bacterium]